MTSKNEIKIQRYPILRLIGAIYKLLAGLVTIVALGVTIIVVFGPPTTANLLQRLWNPGLLYLVSGGLAGMSFYALSRLIDLLLETNNNTRMIADSLEDQNKLLKQIYDHQQSRPRVDVDAVIAERQKRLASGGKP